ncbi:MAG: hypothetical protein NE330_10575 [Lentisphaeraceae bacterium]|nr:hypothetical protein [Lentisphaeraceae bacterium]
MIKDILNSVNGLGIWGSAAIILFFMVFAWWIFSTLMMNNQHVEHMGSLPLENGDEGKDA